LSFFHLYNETVLLTLTKTAAQSFVDDYYESLNKRQPLGQYYASASKHLTSASVKPDISINGRVVESVADYEAMLDAQGINVTYEVQSFDAHPANANYAIGCPENISVATSSSGDSAGRAKLNKSVRDGDRVSFAIQVSGTVRYGKPSEAPAPGTAATTATVDPAAAAAVTGANADAAAKGSRAPVEIPAFTDKPLEKAFTESWLLVPHWEALGRNPPRGLRKWLVVSQNFRAL
jgi:NTF2-related export protein 1/2